MAIPTNCAAIWDLTRPLSNTGKPESAFGLGSGKESVLGKDGRTMVPASLYGKGGKYRSIIKLLIRYEHQPDDNNWGMGTGWLIAPDILVTAGHCAYDFGEDKYGRAVIVKAYMGYSGKANLESGLASGDVQLRMGKTFITTSGWLQSEGGNRSSDVSFLKLENAFTGNDFKPFSYVDTPLSGSDTIGVVGYPADKPGDEDAEKGSRMYELFINTEWDIAKNKRNMLAYPLSTFAGQSGSPVIRQSDGVSIGAHVYGGSQLNSASIIGGTYGNNFNAYVKVFSNRGPTIAIIGDINIVETAGTGVDYASTPDSNETGSVESFLGNGNDAESFWSALKDIGKVAIPLARTGIQFASPLLGPVGPPAAGLAGVALGVLGKMCESAFDNGTQTLRMVPKPTPKELDGIAQRAALAEATLQTVLKIDSDAPESKLILSKMAQLYSSKKLQAAVAPKLFQCIAGPVLRISMEPPKPTGSSQTVHVLRELPNSRIDKSESSFTSSTEAAFAAQLLQPTVCVSGEEGFFDFLGSAIKSGLKYAPLLGNAAKKGIDLALSSLNATESAIDSDHTDNALADTLFRRAVVAECALQAVQQINVEQLKNVHLVNPESDGENTESFFGAIKTSMQFIARKIIQTAPDVIRNVGPVAINLLSTAIEANQKSEPRPKSEPVITNGGNLKVPSQPKLKTKTSIGAMAQTRQANLVKATA